MDEFEVVCVDRELFPGGGFRIFQLGVRQPRGGPVSVISEGEIQRNIRRGTRYFVTGGGAKAFLTISISERGTAFVETIADQTKLNNLAALPTCQGDHKAPHRPGSGAPGDPNDVDAGSDGGSDPGGPDTDVDQGNNDEDHGHHPP